MARIGDWAAASSSAASAASDDEEGGAGALSWEEFVEDLQRALMGGGVKRVRAALEELEERVQGGDLPSASLSALLPLLLPLYPRPSLAHSSIRPHLLHALSTLLTTAPALLPPTLAWHASEVARLGTLTTPASSRFSLLVQTSTVWEVFMRSSDEGKAGAGKAWDKGVDALKGALDLLLASEDARPSVRQGGVVHVRRTIRTNHSAIPHLLNSLLSPAHAQPSTAPLLGLVIDVAIRLRAGSEQTKGALGGVGRTYVAGKKDEIRKFWITVVLGSKTALPARVTDTLGDYVKEYVGEEELAKEILPAMEKMLLRSPEVALPAITAFFSSYAPSPLASLPRLLPPLLSSSKSSNALTRSSSVALFRVLSARLDASSDLSKPTADILALPKQGKTSSPEHRATLFVFLSLLPPSPSASPTIAEALPPLLAKEPNDAAALALTDALVPHLSFALATHALKSTAYAPLVSALGSAKVNVRRATVAAVGEVVWRLGEAEDGKADEEFVKALLPALEGNLKTVSTNALNAPAGPLEGYVAVAALKGPLAKSDIVAVDTFVGKNPVLQGIATVGGAKPSFLLLDKVYRKLTAPEDEIWLLRALETLVLDPKLTLNESLTTALGLALLHLSISSPNPSTRRTALSSIRSLAALVPTRTPSLIREGVRAILQGESARPARGLAVPLIASVAFGEDVDAQTRDEAVAKACVVAHHPGVDGKDRTTWVEMALGARVDLGKLVGERAEELKAQVIEACESTTFAPAAPLALTTLAFVAPASTVLLAVAQIWDDLAAESLDFVDATAIGISRTPEGTAFVDVLAGKGQAQDKNRKDYEIERWEAEIRESLARKKAAAPVKLTPKDKAAVDAQLKKETAIRAQVRALEARLRRGLTLLDGLAKAQADAFQPHVAGIVQMMLKGVLRKGSLLVGDVALRTFLGLAECCSDRLSNMRTFLGLAVLRSYEIHGLPEEQTAEPVANLIARVLHRMRSLSEQAPLDATTFSYASPLLDRVIAAGGIGLEKDDTDGVEEQLTLALDIIAFHCGAAADAAFPRVNIIKDLLRIIGNHTRLAKSAVGALVDLGESIRDNATPDEYNALIRGTLADEVYVRNACLQALQPVDLTDLEFSSELWIACHDEDEQNTKLASHIWEDNGLDVPEGFLPHLLPFLDHVNVYVRASNARALADAVQSYPQQVSSVLKALEDMYREKAKPVAPEFDEFGMIIPESLDRADPWPARKAIALAFQNLAPLFTDAEVVPFFDFLIAGEALGDAHSGVRRDMLDSGIAIIDLHGKNSLQQLIVQFESFLKEPSSTETRDRVFEAVIILFGRLARHLDAKDERVPLVVDRLIDALQTPSELVQSAIAECLPPLIQTMPERTPALVEQLLKDLVEAPKYAARRGAAYGLAGVVKGRGISALKEFDILRTLKRGAEDKKNSQARQGALFAFETFSTTLGRLFEPWIPTLVPFLLTCFGDASADVREATQDAARVIMSNISGYCVKVILPSLLEGLDEKQWRTKKGSIELLGAMAYMNPKQLSISLPTIIPHLADVLTDSHAQVRAAANAALKTFGEVINNPEIQAMVPILVKALVDPTTKTSAALTALLNTSFVHYIDAPSLALVIPIIERGLRERSAEIKRKATQIIGNLASLTDSRDIVPYMTSLLGYVHAVLVDPVPEARATAAKTLGSLVERLGEDTFPDMIPNLINMVRSDTSGVDRQGAAQGLAEVLSGLGMERMESLLPSFLDDTKSSRPYVREGAISLLIYLPTTFGHRFIPHLGRIVPPILSGLADDSEFVREASMRASRMIIANYSARAVDLLLPELERGLFDESWRIRLSSSQLIGDLLFRISGISGKVEVEEEEEGVDTAAGESSRKALIDALGQERRDRILSAIYLARNDQAHAVRQAAIHIWKALVVNTPRTVREIMPTLISQIVNTLASDGLDMRETAARTLGDLSRKLGEKIMGEIIPILRAGTTAPDVQTRQGVCLAFSEILANAGEAQIEDHQDAIIAAVRICLVDEDPRVRAAAAQAFDAMQEHIGPKAIDETIPTLLEALRQPGATASAALEALKEVMTVRSAVVFPVLVPNLIAQPITVFKAHAMAALVTVAGNALSKRLTSILTAYTKALETETYEDVRGAIGEALRAVLGSVEDAEGLNTLMLTLLGWAKHESVAKRISGNNLLAIFAAVTEQDFSYYRLDWLRQLIDAQDDREPSVVESAWNALDALVKTIPKDELEDAVVPARRAIEGTGAAGRVVPGFSRPKGISPLVPIVLAGLLTGNAEQREAAAYAIGDLVERTSDTAVKPFVVQLTGPLIRIQGEKVPPQIKAAILHTLNVLLIRIPTFVKPFFPQLSRVLVKAVDTPDSLNVRTRAATALGTLLQHLPRVDPLVTELINNVRSAESADVQASFALALANVVASAAKSTGEPVRASIIELIEESFAETKREPYNGAVASLIANLAAFDAEIVRSIFDNFLLSELPPTQLVSITLLNLIEHAPNAAYNLGVAEPMVQRVIACVRAEQPAISRPGREARDLLKNTAPYADDFAVQALI